MSKPITLRLFAFSPEDLRGEKFFLCKTVHEMNRVWAEKNVQLKLVKWETDILRFMKNLDFLINKQNEDYCIVIGIFWKFFDLEETSSEIFEQFKRLQNHFDNSEGNIRAMLYFNIINQDDMGKNSVKVFKELDENNILNYDYKGVEGFYPLIKKNLTEEIQDWGEKWRSTQKSKKSFKRIEPIKVQQNSDLKSLNEVLISITDILKILTENLSERGSELNINENNKPDDEIIWKILEQIAKDMEQFVVSIKPQIPVLGAAISTSVSSLTLTGDDSKDRLLDLKENILKFEEYIIEFREVVSKIPPLTNNMEKARNNTVFTLDSLINEIGKGKNLMLIAEKQFNDSYS